MENIRCEAQDSGNINWDDDYSYFCDFIKKELTEQRDLFPVLNKKDNFQLDERKKLAKDYIAKLLVLTDKEQKYLDCFEQKMYKPELLFDDMEIVERVRNHPMALWKCREQRV